MAETKFEHKIDVTPGHCLLHKDPNKNFGVAACRIWFYVIGEKGAVQLNLGTDWYPEAARRHLSQFPRRDDVQPQGWDIGYHSKLPHYNDQKPMQRDCELTGGVCYYDGSSLQADDWVEGFVCGGTAWLWPKLEEYYRFTFEDGPHPDLTPIPKKNPRETENA